MKKVNIAVPPLRWEMLMVSVIGWACLVSIPLALGTMGVSWDALNHHIYLGWTANQQRFGKDVLAASYQVFQYPYSYWPVYKLSAAGMAGPTAGALLASLQAIALPAVWLIARHSVPGSTWNDVIFRALGVLLGFLSIVVLSMFDSTSNDLLVAVPFVWAVALALMASRHEDRTVKTTVLVLASGILVGVAVAGKLSNGPLALAMPVLWLMAGRGAVGRLRYTVIGFAGAAAGFACAYGSWGWLLWQQTGNPIYPFGDPYFDPLRRILDRQP